MKAFCSYCHAPVFSAKEVCSFECRFLLLLTGRLKVLHFVRLCLAALLFLFVVILGYRPELLGIYDQKLVVWGVFFGSTGLIVLIGLSYLLRFLSSIRPEKKEWGIGLILLAVFVDYFYSLFQVFFLKTSFEASPTAIIPFFLGGFIIFVFFVITLVGAFFRKLVFNDIWQIIKLRPLKARLIYKKQVVETVVSDLKEGDLVQVEAGDLIPCDGVIVSGTTSVDESVFTAEESTFLKSKGDRVYGASLNRDGTIVIEVVSPVSKHFLETMINFICYSITNPELVVWWAKKRIVNIFFIIAVHLVVGFAFYYQEQLGNPFLKIPAAMAVIGLYFSYDLASIFAALSIGKIAKNGVLIRSSGLFKKLARMNYLFFEKTGTLTKGDYIFSQLFLEREVNQGMLLSLLFSLEACSDHPLANGVKTHPWYLEFSPHKVEDFKVHPGLGICGTVCEHGRPRLFAAVGNMRFLKRLQMQISRALRIRLEELESVGETVVLCGWDGYARGLVSFADTLRSDAKPLMSKLKKLKIEPVMITGDHGEMIAHLAYAHGLKEVYTRCLPEEKANKIKNQQEKGAVVGTVGNFLGEDISLAQADIGVVFGRGITLYDEKADIVILGQRLLRLAGLIQFSRKVFRRFKFGSLISILSIIGFLVLVVLGMLGPEESILLTALLSVYIFVMPLGLKKGAFEQCV